MESRIPMFAYIDKMKVLGLQRKFKKRSKIDIAEVQHMLKSKEINEINWIPSKQNLADELTKMIPMCYCSAFLKEI